MSGVRWFARTIWLAPVLLLASSRGDLRADDQPAAAPPPPVTDPWPLAGSAPTHDGDAAHASIDAVIARRQTFALARVAAALEGAIAVPAEPESPQTAGRLALSPALAARGLRVAASRAKEAESRTVPEVASVLAAAAFDGLAIVASRPVLPGAQGTIDRVFKGRFVPQSIDDRPYVLRPNRMLSDLKVLPPPPPPKSPATPASDLVVRGVRIDVDEALLRRALSVPSAPSEWQTLDEIETALIDATDGDAAAAALAKFSSDRKAEVLRARTGAVGLTRVSLRALLAKPPALDATVASLTRIFGVACDPASGDVTIVGIEERGVPAIPLEALALAMRSVWREGRVPGCSLDPDPANPGGPQTVRVFGVPTDSRFALTMLEADYVMKKIVGRAPGAPPSVEGLIDLPAAMTHVGIEGLTSSRFWLTPVPPGPGDVLAAPGGAAALFEARVRVRSEQMKTAGLGAEVGTGSATTAAAECAKSLSDHYEGLVEKAPEFRRLRALFDTVTCARILRILAPRHPMLDRLADLPYAKADVPKSYPGITVTHQLDGRVIVLQGGCDLDTRLSARAFLDVAHPTFSALASAGADGALPGERPLAGQGSNGVLDDGLLAAGAELAAGHAVEAMDRLSDLLDLAPGDPDVLSLRGLARVKAGYAQEGVLDATEAAALDPQSLTLAATLRHIRVEAGDVAALDDVPAAEAEVLEAIYVTLAAQEGVAGRFQEAVAAAASAMRARPGSATAKLVHATLLFLSGDVVKASREASELAAADPKAVEARVLAAVLELRRGAPREARRSLDAALAIRPAADALAYRALAWFLDGDLAHAAADVAAAIALDAAEPAIQQVVEAFRGAACFGRERAAELAKAQLSLPPTLQLAIYSAQMASARGADAEAATELERALAGLDDPSVSSKAVEAGYVRESLEIMLAKALKPRAMADESVRARMDALIADVERRHPTWASPDWIRGGFAQARGDGEEALAAFARCHDKDPTGDVLLAQMMPPDKASLEIMLSTVELGLLLISKGGPGDPRMAVALDHLDGALRGKPTAAVIAALRTLFSTTREDDPAQKLAIDKAFKDTSKALEAAPPGSYGAPESLVLAMFHAMHVNAEAMKGPDGLAAPLTALRSLAPRGDVYEPVWSAVSLTRKEATSATFAGMLGSLDSDPRTREAEELAVTDPEPARKRLDDAVRPVFERVAQIGDPVLSFLVARFLAGNIDSTMAKGMAERIKRIDRVLEVAVDPKKVEKLQSSKATLLASLKALDAKATTTAQSARKAALAAMRTPVDLKTFTLLDRQVAERDKGASLGAAGPDDARRLLELSLAAYLRASSVPVPESIK